MMLLTAIAAATWLAYGIDPTIAAKYGGLALVTLTRRLQWVLILASILPCLGLIVRVSMGKARAWWLIGLSIVVALMFVRFSPDSSRPVRVVDASMLPTLKDIKPDEDAEFVVGLRFEGNSYAFPYRVLYRTPIVQLTDFDKRLIVIFSPYANSATALEVSHEIKAEDLEYVSSPGNATLVYNRKYGQFILGLTGRTDRGDEPIGVRGVLPVERVPTLTWRSEHPESKIILADAADASLPGLPLLPRYPIKLSDQSVPPEQPITLLHTDPPTALLDVKGIGAKPVRVTTGQTPLVLWRDGSRLRAFLSRVGNQVLGWRTKKDAKGAVQIVDSSSNSVWQPDGTCTQGPLKGKRLTSVRVEEDVYWGVSKTWWPDLRVGHLEALP
ncbi:MAG: DUF3179 domain-containing (seleno)protein [Tepidisphaeraceae bacterium]